MSLAGVACLADMTSRSRRCRDEAAGLTEAGRGEMGIWIDVGYHPKSLLYFKMMQIEFRATEINPQNQS